MVRVTRVARPVRRLRRAAADRVGGRLRQPGAGRGARTLAPVRRRSSLRHRPRVRHDAHAPRVRRARRPLRHRRRPMRRRARCCGWAPTNSSSAACPPTLRWRRRWRWRRTGRPRVRQRRAPQGRGDADGVAVGVGAPELSRLDRDAARSTSSARTTQASSAMERMNVPATGDDASRRVRPGPLVAVGRGRGRGRRRASACSTPAPRRAAKRLRSPPTGARVVAADVRPNRRVAWSPPTPSVSTPTSHRRRRRDTATRSRARRSTPCWSTPRAADSAPCDAAPTRAGGSSRATRRSRRAAAPDRSTPSAALVDPGGRLVYSVCTLTAAESIDHPDPGRASRSTTAVPRGRHVASVPPRLASAAARRRHRRHGPDSVPSAGHERRVTAVAKVLTVSDGVFHGARDDTRRPRARRPPRRQRLRGGRPSGHRRRRRRRGRDAERDERRLRRTDRHDRRHRLRAPRPDARGHTRGDRARGAGSGRGDAPRQPSRPPVARGRRHPRQRHHLQHARAARRARSNRSTPSSTSCRTPSGCCDQRTHGALRADQ